MTVDSNPVFWESQSVKSGGILYAYKAQPGATTGYFNFLSGTYTDLNALENGGAMAIESSMISSLIIEVQVTNSSAAYSGGVVYIGSEYIGNIDIQYSRFTRLNASEEGSLFYSSSPQLTLNILSNNVECFTAYDSAMVNTFLNLTYQQPIMAGAFYIKGAIKVLAKDNKMFYCYVCSKGGAFQLINVLDFEDSMGYYEGMAALSGGFFYIDGSNTVFDSTYFQNSLAYSGGTISQYNQANMQIKEIFVLYSYALSEGGVFGIFLNSQTT